MKDIQAEIIISTALAMRTLKKDYEAHGKNEMLDQCLKMERKLDRLIEEYYKRDK